VPETTSDVPHNTLKILKCPPQMQYSWKALEGDTYCCPCRSMTYDLIGAPRSAGGAHSSRTFFDVTSVATASAYSLLNCDKLYDVIYVNSCVVDVWWMKRKASVYYVADGAASTTTLYGV